MIGTEMHNKQFNTDDPIAYFITWTTYGTWLPGDERGWNRRGDHESLAPNRFLSEFNASRMKETEFVLNHGDQEIVADTITKHCEIRKWELHAMSVRSNHVHVVVTTPECTPETVRDQLKAWCSRLLKRNHPDRTRFWTEGASCRWINTNDDLESAMEYVLEAQDRKGVEYQD